MVIIKSPSDLTSIPIHLPLLILSSEVTIGKFFWSIFQNILTNIAAFHFTVLCIYPIGGISVSARLCYHNNSFKFQWLTTLVYFLLTLHLVSCGLAAAFLEPWLKEQPLSAICHLHGRGKEQEN